MNIRMLPIDFVFQRLPRLVRDLCEALGKQAELKISGGGTEVDKTVLEKIADPLVHLVRNALDHGIEAPSVRAAAGKPQVGAIELKAFHESGNIVIRIRDDGAGLKPIRSWRRRGNGGLLRRIRRMMNYPIRRSRISSSSPGLQPPPR